MDKIRERQLARLDYRDPEEFLREIMPTVAGILQQPHTVKHFSDREKNRYLEKHQAGFLALLWKRIGQRPNVEIKLAFNEAVDFDCVVRAIDPVKGTVYKPVQLKQLPSHEVNEKADLQTLIDRLKVKYGSSTDLAVGIWINRDIKVDFDALDFSGLKIDQLWFFGDSVSGALTLDGGLVAQLLSGVRYTAQLNGMDVRVRPVRFRNGQGRPTGT